MHLQFGTIQVNQNAGTSEFKNITDTFKEVGLSDLQNGKLVSTNLKDCEIAFNATTDLYLAVFSTYIFWSLNLKLRVKLGLVALLGMGILYVKRLNFTYEKDD